MAGTMADQTAEALRREAEQLRERGRWRDAADVYAALLMRHPDDAGALAQRAFCLGEAGQAEASLTAYRAAMVIRPQDPCLPLQLGQALARLGRSAEAEAAFARAVALAPGDDGIWRGWQAHAEPAPAIADQLLDLTDLVTALLREERPSPGAFRLQRDLAYGALLGETPPTLCALAPGKLDWQRIPAGLFHRLDHLLAAAVAPLAAAWDWQEALALLAQAMAAAPLALPAGATLVCPGDAWSIPHHFAALRRAREASGLRFIPLLRDTAALAVPEQLPPVAAQAQIRWLAALPQHADGLLLASPAVARSLRPLNLPDSTVVRLDAATRAAPASATTDNRQPANPQPASPQPASPQFAGAGIGNPAAGATAAPTLRSLLPRQVRSGRPFVMFVAPLDARKDHRFVLGAWLELLRRPGADTVPDLVCVGRPGWGAEAALDLLENAPALRGRVHLLQDVADATLAALYHHARFTLFHSHHEGWSLAVAESLAHGRPVLLPGHSGLLEAGPAGLFFFQAGSEPSLIEQLQALISDPGLLAAAEAALAATPRPAWTEVATRQLAAARDLVQEAQPRPPLPLQPGRRIPLRRLDRYRPLPDMAVAEAARAGGQWHPLEDWGVWSRPGIARLSLSLAPGLSGALRLELDLRAPAQDQALARQARRPGGSATPPIEILLPAGSEQTISLAVPPGEGPLDILLDCGRPVQQPGGPRVGIGLRALCLARADSTADRLAMLESRRFLVAERLEA
jgi:glycosyltransferase involved in cell wall biosynthesis